MIRRPLPEPIPDPFEGLEGDTESYRSSQEPTQPDVYRELREQQQDQHQQDSRESESDSKSLEPSKVVQAELSPAEETDIIEKTWLKIYHDPNTELTQLETTLLYGVDKDLVGDELTRAKAAIVREARGERDYEQVKSLIIERMRSEKNVIQTTIALQSIVEGLGLDPAEYSPVTYMHTLLTTMADWHQRGIYDYLTRELIDHNSRHNIVPVPNAEFGAEDIIQFAKKFGEGQPKRTKVIDEELEEEFYTMYASNELCGEKTDGQLRLVLIPSSFANEGKEDTLENQRKQLNELQAILPRLHYSVPSVLEAIAHWYVLRAGGDELVDKGAYERSYIRQDHTMTFDQDEFSPLSYVVQRGGPILNFRSTNDRLEFRFSVR